MNSQIKPNIITDLHTRGGNIKKMSLQKQVDFLSYFPNQNPAPVFSLNNHKKILYCNQSAKSLLDYWYEEYNRQFSNRLIDAIDWVLKTQKQDVVEERWEEDEYLFSITPGIEGSVNIYGTNIAKLKKAEKELVYLSRHDTLTGLYNRNAFEKKLNQAAIQATKNNGLLAILLLDLDNFKSVNDSFGHHIGDQLLVKVAEHLKAQVREGDIVARLGGDEFIILLHVFRKGCDVETFAKTLIKRFNQPFQLENHHFSVTASVGISLAPSPGKDTMTLLKNADIALYDVKALGKNNYQFYTDSMHDRFKRQAELETHFEQALSKNEFFLVYQPQYQLPKEIPFGMEVLLRWHHPKLGLIPPDEFIPMTEKKGFIVKLGRWVLRNACAQYVTWLRQGVIPEGLTLAINVSPLQLQDKAFLESVEAILKETKMPAKNLEFELTETAVMTNHVEMDSTLLQLSKMNIRISIDDFGTGYSSLARLRDLPINSLKIDKSFVKDLTTDHAHAMIVKSIIALGNSLGLTVITEGVETEEQLRHLLHDGCQYVQGFYFGKKPLNVDEMYQLFMGYQKH